MSEFINTSDERLVALNEFVQAILSGENAKEMFQKHEKAIKSITPFDVLNLTAWKAEEKMSTQTIKSIAGKLMNAFHEGLKTYEWPKEKTSLFVENLMKETKLIKKHCEEMRSFFRKEKIAESKAILKERFKALNEVDKHYIKIQTILFPYLEVVLPNPRPLGIIWSLQDDERSLRKEILAWLESPDDDILGFIKRIGEHSFLIFGIFQKEETLLLPIASRVITEDQWQSMLEQSVEYGYAFMETPLIEVKQTDTKPNLAGLLFQTHTGGLALDELLLVLDKLGVDFTFVDADDRVKYFNNPKDRMFPRSPAIIGRHVNQCHPPESVHVVEEIVEAFKRGERSEAKFWLTMRGRFIVISYFALFDEEKHYKGVLEVSQDVTHIRALKGERRLLAWDEEE